MSRSLAGRLRRISLLAVLPVLVALAGLLFWTVRAAVWDRFDADLRAHASTLASLVEYDEDGYEFELGPEPDPLTRGAGQASFVQVWYEGDRTLSRTRGLEYELPRDGPRDAILMLELAGRRLRLVTLEFTPEIEDDAAPEVRPPQPITLVLARETTSTEQMLARLGAWFVWLVVITLGAATIATSWAIRRGLLPLRAIATELERIDVRALGRRLDGSTLPAEIRPIVATTNGLLDRLERAFARERQLSSDIAHELRTPLGVLQTSLELCLRRARSSEEYRAALAEALADVRQLGALVGNLLELARLEGTQAESKRVEVKLRELIVECWAKHDPLARERGLAFSCELSESLRIVADREKLTVIANNLLANAVQYTEAGGWIRVESEPDHGLILAVVDSGPQLSAEQLEHVFDRFWRADAARAEAGNHCGIGLALVRSLAEASGARVHAENREDGSLAFELTDANSCMVAHVSRPS